MIATGQATDVGLVRSRQEDRIFDSGVVFGVADGMGGLARGDFAAATVAQVFSQVCPAGASTSELRTLVREATNSAHDLITKDVRPLLQFGRRADTGAGSTVAGFAHGRATAGAAWLIFHVGDSRVYSFDGELTQLTADHSVVQEMVSAGMLTPAEARHHPRRNIVTRAVGTLVSHQPSFSLVPDHGQVLLACTDGVTDELSDDQIAHILAAHDDLQEAARTIVQRAVGAGGHDNATVILARSTPEEGQL